MIDVILTSYNRLPLLRQTVDSFLEHTDMGLVEKIIITDDGSTDGTGEYLKQLGQRIACLHLVGEDGQRKGLVERFNEAFALTSSEYICEFQDDVTFAPRWLELLMEGLRQHDVAFASGFDAPEHSVFQDLGGKKLKFSSRFTQLLARKSTWARWFPMKPSYSFPTPCIKDGICYGSNIDCKIYNFSKNKRSSGVKYLVLPGLVQHHAEHSGSLWRKEKEEKAPSALRQNTQSKSSGKHFQGGLGFESVEAYWQQRSSRHQERTVGFLNLPLPIQEEHYQIRYDFLLPRIPQNLKTIDFGCGIGRYSRFFEQQKYLGLDISQNLLHLAQKNNPGYHYQKLTEPILPQVDFVPELFFTTTVLQHNNEEMVQRIFASLQSITEGQKFLVCLYENSSNKKDSSHICFRSSEKYLQMLEAFFSVGEHHSFSHLVHGEEHSLLLAWVK